MKNFTFSTQKCFLIGNLLNFKLFSLVFLVLFGSGSVWGQSAGFNNTFIVLSLNGGANAYYDLNATTPSPDFNTANLGTFAADQ